ncbi:MAG: hypothetical protein H0U25_09325, partial [Thermoleophilaceae bacterium]|nr:hypothetical protein [Thermoleophilaceae bacterium]
MSGLANPRVRLAILVLLVAGVGLGVLVTAGSGGDAPDAPVRAELTLKRTVLPTTGQPELLVSLPDDRQVRPPPAEPVGERGRRRSEQCQNATGRRPERERRPPPVCE